MGILNVTPDSFSDGGKYVKPQEALKQALQMIKEGADIIDIGGESSGPNSKDVTLKEELRRVIPVVLSLRALVKKEGSNLLISVDTWKAEVARQAVMAGANMINDVTALRGDPGMAKIVAQTGVPIVLMYSKDPTARTTRTQKRYKNVVKTIIAFLQERVDFALAAGIKRTQIILDPGMGAFVSSIPKYSYEILERLKEFKKLGFPILVGASRKSFLPGTIHERLAPTLKAHRLAVQNGAAIIRVHDVQAHQSLRK